MTSTVFVRHTLGKAFNLAIVWNLFMLTHAINIPLGSSLKLEELDIDLDNLDLEKDFPNMLVNKLLSTPVDRLQDDEILTSIHIKPTLVGHTL